MALSQAQMQAVIGFARINRLDPLDMVAILDIAMMTPFVDANSGVQMVNLLSTVDGVTRSIGWESALKMRDYYARIGNGGIVVQRAEFTIPNNYPGIPS